MFPTMPEQCQNLMQSAQTFFAPNIPHIMISDFPPDFKPFRLVKICDILMKLSGHVFLKVMKLYYTQLNSIYLI